MPATELLVGLNFFTMTGLSLVMYMIWRTRRELVPAAYVSVAYALAAAGWLLTLIRDLLPDSTAEQFGNILYVLALAASFSGICRYAGVSVPRRLIGGYVVGAALVFALFSDAQAVAARVVALSVILSLPAAAGTWLFARCALRQRRAANLLCAVFLGLFVILLVARIPLVIIDAPRAATYLETISGLLILVVQPAVVICYGLSFILALILKLVDELHDLATRDPLTRILNRRAFFEAAARELERNARYHRPLSLILLDLDRFKSINDRYGHAVGDGVLMAVTRQVSKNLRSSDLFGRLGGEEFAILLPETDLDSARAIADRLREAIDGIDTRALASGLSVTASFGVTGVGDASKGLDPIFKQADRALYRAKDSGRDQVVTA